MKRGRPGRGSARDRAGRAWTIALGTNGAVSMPAERGAASSGSQAEGPVERMRVGVDEQLRRIEPMAVRRVIGPVGAQAVAGARPEPGDEAAEDVAFLARQHEAGGFLFAPLVEQAEHDALGVVRDDGDVDAGLLNRHAERLGRARRTWQDACAFMRCPPRSERFVERGIARRRSCPRKRRDFMPRFWSDSQAVRSAIEARCARDQRRVEAARRRPEGTGCRWRRRRRAPRHWHR